MECRAFVILGRKPFITSDDQQVFLANLIRDFIFETKYGANFIIQILNWKQTECENRRIDLLSNASHRKKWNNFYYDFSHISPVMQWFSHSNIKKWKKIPNMQFLMLRFYIFTAFYMKKKLIHETEPMHTIDLHIEWKKCFYKFHSIGIKAFFKLILCVLCYRSNLNCITISPMRDLITVLDFSTFSIFLNKHTRNI